MDASSDSPNSETAARLTPMMAQYLEIKAANPDCLLFYRMGDFYELFFDDAEIASRALGIVLTKRGKHEGEDIRMCGVPVERADDYLNRLIALGHRVAVCEQLEDPAEAKKRGAKSVVKRDVVRLVTPGTITEERLLEPGRARLLLAVQKRALERGTAGLRPRGARYVDRRLRAQRDRRGGPCRGDRAPRAERDRRAASACSTNAVFPDRPRDARSPRRRSRATAATARRPNAGSANSMASKRSTASARSPAPRSPPPRSRSAYVKRTQIEARPALSPPTRRARGTSLEIDAATRANLELTRTLAGERDGSLLATIDLTVTPAGARLLAERLASPLTDPEAINRRLDRLRFSSRRRRCATRCARRSARARLPARARAAEPRPRRPARSCRHARRPRRGGALASMLAAAQELPPALMSAYRAAARRLRRTRARSRCHARRRIAASEARRRLRARRRAAGARRGARACATKAAASSPKCRRPTPRRRASGSSRSSTTTFSATSSRRRRRRRGAAEAAA